MRQGRYPVGKHSSTWGYMRELALFAGAGGGILAGHILGWRTVCAVERDAHAAEVLAQRQNDGILSPFPIWSDVTTFNGYSWQGRVDVISGGFPCQDISAAGKGTGITGKRSGLWKEMARIICEVRPRFVFVENSPLLTSRGLDVVLGDLAAMGFNAEWGVFGASDAGASHQRDRIWVLAYASSFGRGPRREDNTRNDGAKSPTDGQLGTLPNSDINEHKSRPYARLRQGEGEGAEVVLSDAIGSGLAKRERKNTGRAREVCRFGEPGGITRRPTEPGLGRMVDGVAYRMDVVWPDEPADIPRVAKGVPHRVGRLKGIGNGQVPACAMMAWLELLARLSTENYDLEMR